MDEVLDLRLAPAAAASWLVCGLVVGGTSRSALLIGGVVTAGILAGVLVLGTGSRVAGTGWLALAAVAAVSVSGWAHLTAREQGLLPELVRTAAVAEVVAVVRSDPRGVADPWVRPAPGGGTAVPTRYLALLAVEQVSGRGRTSLATGPVLLVGGRPWGDVPYGARVLVSGRFGASGDGRHRAVLVAPAPPVVLDPPGAVDSAMNGLRSALLEVTDDLPADARGLVPGAAVGDTTRVPADLEQAMRDVGLTHVTAVSGAHFAVLSVTVLALTALLRLPRPARALVTGSVMAGFVLLVHPDPSVVRAAAMGAVAVLGLVLGRPSRGIAALGAAVVVLLVLDPWLARALGFVLSVLATGAIILLAPPLAGVIERAAPRWVALAVAIPVAAQAACAPVVLLMTPGVAVYAVPANLLAAPALLPATLLGVGATLAAPGWPGLGEVLAHGAAGATWWIAEVARTAAALPGARMAWPSGPVGAILLAIVTAAALAAALFGRTSSRPTSGSRRAGTDGSPRSAQGLWPRRSWGRTAGARARLRSSSLPLVTLAPGSARCPRPPTSPF